MRRCRWNCASPASRSRMAPLSSRLAFSVSPNAARERQARARANGAGSASSKMGASICRTSAWAPATYRHRAQLLRAAGRSLSDAAFLKQASALAVFPASRCALPSSRSAVALAISWGVMALNSCRISAAVIRCRFAQPFPCPPYPGAMEAHGKALPYGSRSYGSLWRTYGKPLPYGSRSYGSPWPTYGESLPYGSRSYGDLWRTYGKPLPYGSRSYGSLWAVHGEPLPYGSRSYGNLWPAHRDPWPLWAIPLPTQMETDRCQRSIPFGMTNPPISLC